MCVITVPPPPAEWVTALAREPAGVQQPRLPFRFALSSAFDYNTGLDIDSREPSTVMARE
ncbi:MAG: hypothetical protein M1482_12795 [Chloroflexi bacterium]|nr:hypothetical protein [Chloroflexota bacterium]